MNLLWIAAIALFVLPEKVAPLGRAGGRLSGVGLVAAGVAFLVMGFGLGCSSASGPSGDDTERGLTRCEGPRHPICTQDWVPVCGERSDGKRRTYGNACNACADPAVVGHRPGECSQG